MTSKNSKTFPKLCGALIALLLIAPTAGAQIDLVSGSDGVTLGGDVKPLRALRITLSGEMRLDFVYRNDRYFNAALGDAVTGAAGAPLGWTGSATGDDGDAFLNPWISIDIDTQLADGVNALITLETPFDAFTDNVGGSDSGRTLDVDQAYVQWLGAFVPDLALIVGIQDYKVDFAGNGTPFFVDVGNSESAFGTPSSTAGLDFGSPQAPSAGLVGTQEAAGFLSELNIGDAELDLFYFTLDETFRDGEDEAMFGAVFDYVFETQDWRGQAGFLLIDLMNDSSSSVWTWGGGGHLESTSGDLKVYGEAYGQFGRYKNNLTGFGRVNQSRSFAVFGGIRYYLGGLGEMRPWVDLSYWEISGDDNGNDSRNGNFVSLEANNDTIVLENAYYGLDIDTNYRAFKLKGGLNLSSDWSVEGMYSFFELQDNSNGTAANSSNSDKLGDEIDIKVNYRATDYLNFQFASGWLFDAEALGVGSDIMISVLSAEIRF